MARSSGGVSKSSSRSNTCTAVISAKLTRRERLLAIVSSSVAGDGRAAGTTPATSMQAVGFRVRNWGRGDAPMRGFGGNFSKFFWSSLSFLFFFFPQETSFPAKFYWAKLLTSSRHVGLKGQPNSSGPLVLFFFF